MDLHIWIETAAGIAGAGLALLAFLAFTRWRSRDLPEPERGQVWAKRKRQMAGALGLIAALALVRAIQEQPEHDRRTLDQLVQSMGPACMSGCEADGVPNGACSIQCSCAQAAFREEPRASRLLQFVRANAGSEAADFRAYLLDVRRLCIDRTFDQQFPIIAGAMVAASVSECRRNANPAGCDTWGQCVGAKMNEPATRAAYRAAMRAEPGASTALDGRRNEIVDQCPAATR